MGWLPEAGAKVSSDGHQNAFWIEYLSSGRAQQKLGVRGNGAATVEPTYLAHARNFGQPNGDYSSV
jgi:hypothetical protein